MMRKVAEKTINNILKNDYLYTHWRYYRTFRRPLNLMCPKTFNEKIQWLKLKYRNDLLPKLADKYRVREYVKKRVGEDKLNTLLGVYDSVDSLRRDLDKFPSHYVIKATHGSGWNFLVKGERPSPSQLSQLDEWLHTNYYELGREWCYKNIEPRIIVEKFITPENKDLGLFDYKLFCFHGEPKFVQVDIGRYKDHTRAFYDMSWNLVPVKKSIPQTEKKTPRPKKFHKMVSIASKLSKEFPFARIDLYSADKIIFGEITFYPGCGFSKFEPEKFDYKFGSLLKLNDIK